MINQHGEAIDHHLLGLHHVNETAPPEQWLYWDLGFLAWGAVMAVAGWLLLRVGKQETAMTAAHQRVEAMERG